MSTPTLSTCPDVATPQQGRSGRLERSGAGYASRQAKKRAGFAVETWDVEWTALTATESAALVTIFETVGYHDYFKWTPPKTGASVGAYSFENGSFRQEALNHNTFRIKARLVKRHGIFVS